MGPRPGVATGAVALLVAAAVVTYALVDNETIASICYLAVLVGAAVGAATGAARAPRGERLVPTLIAIGISLTALGDVLWTVLDVMGADTDVSIADPAWFGSYVVLCVALFVVLGRSGRAGRVDVDSLIDMVTIVVTSVVIFWSISIDTIIADQSLTPFVRAVWVAYPIADAVLLALVVRILMTRSCRAALGTSFAVGVCLWLVADIAYLQWSGGGALTDLMDACWMVAPVLMARAAWRTGRPQPEAPESSSLGWMMQILFAGVPLLVPAGLELFAHLRHQEGQTLQLLVGTVALVALAFVRTGRLIGEKERAHAQLEVAHAAALEASRAKSMFLANMSHEIRTPLTTVLATGELLEDTVLDEHQARLVGKMHRSGQLLSTLVEGILDFSRIEAGQLTLSSTAFDLHALAADAVDASRSRVTQTIVRVECRLDPSVPQTVVGDPARLLQILTNLLENALKFTVQGHVTLAVCALAPDVADAAEEWVEFTVTDTGIGIRDQDLEGVFESFRQVDGSTTRRYGGNGLGLAICKDLAALMGGSITVASRLGEGSTFTVRLPLPRAGATIADRASLSFSS